MPRKKEPPEQPINGEVPPKSPGESPSPSAGEGEPSQDSSTASAKGSGPSGPFIADAGPDFEPGAEPGPGPGPGPGELHMLPELAPEWEVETLKRLLTTKGEVIHAFAGVAEQDWRYTKADLEAIAPPLARILNRYPATAAASTAADPLALAIGASAYALRSARERSQVLRERAELEPQPITGAAPPEGAEPPPPPPGPPPYPGQGPDESDLQWRRPGDAA